MYHWSSVAERFNSPMNPAAVKSMSSKTMVGVGYRQPLHDWITKHPPELECLEITAEHFFDGASEGLEDLSLEFPIFVHGLGLSIGTPGPLDLSYLKDFRRVAQAARAQWVSEHIAFTKSSEIDLGHLNPIVPNQSNLDLFVDHAKQVMDFCSCPLVLENITSHIRLKGTLSEVTFLNELCDRSGCGLLLDVTNLFINGKNHGFDPSKWLADIAPESIVQLHVVGYRRREEKWIDSHGDPIQPDLWELIRLVASHASPQAVIIERDIDFPAKEQIEQELKTLKSIFE